MSREVFALVFILFTIHCVVFSSDIEPPDPIEFHISQNYSRVARHRSDESELLPFDSCGGVFRDEKTLLRSPHYPENYSPNLNCRYLFRSPYQCETEFHIQFLAFSLESSPECGKDRLQIGTDVLCGKVIGIRKYKTMDGVLTVVLKTDDWQESSGFDLVVTRLPCGEHDDGDSEHVFPIYEKTTVGTDQVDVNWADEITTKKPFKDLHAKKERMMNQTKSNQYLPSGYGSYLPPSGCASPWNPIPNPGHRPPFGGPNYPTYPNNPSYPGSSPGYFPSGNPPFGQYPTQNYPNYPNYPIYPGSNPGYNPPQYPYPPAGQPPIGNPFPTPIPQPQPPNPQYPYSPAGPPPFGNPFPPPTPQQPIPNPTPNPGAQNPNCIPYPACASIPNTGNPYPNEPPIQRLEHQAQIFPPTVPRCCARSINLRHFFLSSPEFPSRNQRPSDCLYLIDKAHAGICRLRIEFRFFFVGTYNPRLGCTDSFVEIDGQRICGCNTGLRYVSQWGIGTKAIRLFNRPMNAQNVRGFAMDIVQEECPYRITGNQVDRSDDGPYQQRMEDRIDDNGQQPKWLQSEVTHLNSSSTTTTFYYYGEKDDRKTDANDNNRNAVSMDEPTKWDTETKDQFDNRSEAPVNSQFFFLSDFNNPDRCAFGYSHLLKLTADPVWQVRPRCG